MKSLQVRVMCSTNDKTASVEVTRLAPHPKYKRRVRKKNKFQAHDPDNQFKGRDDEEDTREAFNVFDQNGDGFITVDELRSVLASLGLKQRRTMEDCKRMIMKVDGDEDGDGDVMVNFIEFKEMMRAGGFAALTQKFISNYFNSLFKFLFLVYWVVAIWARDETKTLDLVVRYRNTGQLS
ncbi:Calmodulin-like protein [Actinidia chinensis var. chinensis]|uniref:Calmodulin-like protein n=1 Tax=Actinidia chinensis var. chinensis TaxID=1590841 RepID=A0A2R6P5R1_ACTCC|nr:Calmodulin-like protein [Actinidia chinensis var. chinensis]